MKTKPEQNSIYSRLILLLLTAIAIYIRVSGANYYHYSEDESMIYGMANAKSIAQVLQFSLYETHPPLFYILLHYWLMISQEIWFARCLPLLFGVALIPLYYNIGKKIGSDNFTGMCAAILIAFSPVCITQSYLLRHYAMMDVFLGLAFYNYLLWKNEYKNKYLLLYFISALLACFSDFSAIFTLFIIAAYESAILLTTPKKFREKAGWLSINIVVAIFLLLIHKIWSVSIDSNADYFKENNLYTYYYVPIVLMGILINAPIALFIVILSATNLVAKTCSNAAKTTMIWLVMALLLGVILQYNGIYLLGGIRHWSWLLLFVALYFVTVVSDIWKMISNRVPPLQKQLCETTVILALIFVGIFMYSSQARFNDDMEYTISEKNWRDAVNTISNIDKKSVLLAERDDAALLNQNSPYYNMYDDLNHDDAFYNKHPVSLIHYKNSAILTSQYHRRLTRDYTLIDMLGDALKSDTFSGYDNVILFATKLTNLSGDNSVQRLLACPDIEKKVIYFSRQEGDDAHDYDAVFVKIPKRDLLEKVISPTGKAHHCLDEKK